MKFLSAILFLAQCSQIASIPMQVSRLSARSASENEEITTYKEVEAVSTLGINEDVTEQQVVQTDVVFDPENLEATLPNYIWSEHEALLLYDDLKSANVNRIDPKKNSLLHVLASFPDYLMPKETMDTLYSVFQRMVSENRQLFINYQNEENLCAFEMAMIHLNDDIGVMLVQNGASLLEEESITEDSQLENPILEADTIKPNSLLFEVLAHQMYKTALELMIRGAILGDDDSLHDRADYFDHFFVMDEFLKLSTDNTFLRTLYRAGFTGPVKLNETTTSFPIYAFETDKFELFIELIEDGAKLKEDECQMLLSRRENAPGPESIIFAAIRLNNFQLVEAVLKAGASLNVENSLKNSPLHVSIFLELREVTLLLIRHGASLDATNIRNETPFHLAVQKDDEVIANALIEKGVNLLATTITGDTPLHYAILHNKVIMANLILGIVARFKREEDQKWNLILNAENLSHQTPLSIAKNTAHSTLIIQLIGLGAVESDTTKFYGWSGYSGY